jgi:ATP-dependent helicase YprA (DUF1998 family)
VSELLPLSQASAITDSLLDYLGTTFALADPDTRQVLDAFLRDPGTGMFRGPYLRARLPFRPAADGWREHLEWYAGPTPYGHQAAAFARLCSYRLAVGERPGATLVTTGTGSGKTEAFLYPILDHVRRAKRDGVTGMKALILYPMNALANDQAARLAALITANPELAGITAALYTGEAGPKRTMVSADGLITDRAVIRDTAPDVVLTNYKMLDQLLLRAADADLWRQSATSLQYLVLDEFHTYDGAQGTDVSMLLRRLGLTLKSYWPPDDPAITDADRARPLGRITPVATSATLGDGSEPSTMLEFAETVFGETFPAEAVITESRLSIDEWAADAPARVSEAGWRAAELDDDRIAQLAESAGAATDPASRELAVLRSLYDGGDDTTLSSAIINDDPLLLDLVKAHPVTARLADAATDAVELDTLDAALFAAARTAEAAEQNRIATTALVDTLSHLRARHGRGALSVEVHLWVRELTRLDRAATGAPHFVWSDDGIRLGDTETAPGLTGSTEVGYLPALYCRHCNRSGWGVVLAPTGWDLDNDDAAIRRRNLRGDERFRALIHAPVEAAAAEAAKTGGEQPDTDPDAASRLVWLKVAHRSVSPTTPTEKDLAESAALPVLMHCGDDAGKESANDTCPACRQADGIRFLGSAIATMLSVSLSTLFGAPQLDAREKRALVFTDSVQDAAHRAGFIQSRSHALTLRTLVRQALGNGETDVDSLTHRMIHLAGTDPVGRYRLLPPELAEREMFAAFWRAPAASAKARNLVRRRLLLDVELEFGLRSTVGRTLSGTGSVLADVNLAAPVLRACATEALDASGTPPTLGGVDEARLVAWVRGVLEHLRARGAIEHEWFDKFRREDANRWWITGGRRRSEGMPGFGKGSSAPGFPVLGGAARDTDFEPVSSARGWYGRWTAKVLGLPAAEAAVLSRELFAQLRKRDVIGRVDSASGGQTFHLPATSILVRVAGDDEIASGAAALICDICRHTVHSYPASIDQLDGAPCLVMRCEGTLGRHSIADNFYRAMYAATDVRRIVAREHTGLLPAEIRLQYESEFKQTDPPADAPNVLVATPTLEMGIDIGDLSAVLLSSLPRSVASYLQRVGRAGRLTGNALALAYVTGRGDQLPRFQQPQRTINGEVRPPATYLDAEEILRRQFTASVADVLARQPDAPHPHNTTEALHSTEPGSYLGALIAQAENQVEGLTDSFLAGFADLDAGVADRLRQFPRPTPAGPGNSEFAARCHRASQQWRRRVETLSHRRTAVQQVLPELHQRAESPTATDEHQRGLRTAQATIRLLGRQLAELRSEYWISSLESFGLLPNYTLLDDSVTLSVSVNWINPESQQYEHSEFELTRASAQALRDFAPGSTFYSNGFAIEIDAVDLGPDGEEVRTWVCCPRCGYTAETESNTGGGVPVVSKCPRCGSAAIADTSQRLTVAELTNVSAIIRREEATIDDTSEERRRERFAVLALVDIDPANVTKQWFVASESAGFGVKHLRNLRICWVNLGRAGTGGSKRHLAGEEVDATLFRVCSECGKLDTASGVNRRSEHRPWCSRRDATDESTTNLALTRSMVTEGLVLRLPAWITLGDTFATPSLQAAVLLGLREQLGGDPDHLQITTTVDPSPSGRTDPALLLHDVVPGGTGYLVDFTNPAAVWDMLHRAWQIVSTCECGRDGRLACERCLLPFAAPGLMAHTSRSVAARHLAGLLAGREFGPGDEFVVPATMPWSVTTDEPGVDDPESHLERRFRMALRERLSALGASITEKPTDLGISWDIALGSSNRWTLRPQEYVLGSQPDFLLISTRGGVRKTAIFTDGWLYHASAGHNRLADDAQKRRNLRDAGYQVIAVTHQDVEGDPVVSTALNPDLETWLLSKAGDQLSKSTIDLAFGTAIDLLIAWIQDPSDEARGRLANWLPALGLASTMDTAARTGGDELAPLAVSAIDGAVPKDSPGDTAVWSFGGFGFAVRMPGGPDSTEIAVVIDDDNNALGADAKDAWREWLRWSNLLTFRMLPTVITTRREAMSAVPLESPALPAAESRPTEGELSRAWLDAYQQVDPIGRDLIQLLSHTQLPAPDIGEEVDGIPVEISWPQRKVAVSIGLDDDEQHDLVRSGWTLCEPDVDSIAGSLQDGGR